MAELLTTVLVAYALLTAASWQFAWLTERWIVLGMAGTAIPDLVKINILVDVGTVESLLGFQFSYSPLSSLGGVLLVAAAITVFFRRQHARVYGLLVFGGLVGLVLDGLRVFADGRSGFWLYPFAWYRPPTPSLFVSSDPRVLVVALVVSGAVFLLDRRLQRRGADTESEN